MLAEVTLSLFLVFPPLATPAPTQASVKAMPCALGVDLLEEKYQNR